MFKDIMKLRAEFFKQNGFYPSYLICSDETYRKIKIDAEGMMNLMDCGAVKSIGEIAGMKVAVVCGASDHFMDVAGSREKLTIGV